MAPVHAERIVRAFATLVVLLASLTTLQAREEADPLKTEEGLRRVLDQHEALYEKVCSALNEALWQDRTAGPAPGPLAEQREALRMIYADPELSEVISHWITRQIVTNDPSLTERVRVWAGTTALAAVELDPAIALLSDELSRRLATHRYLLDGDRVTRDQLELILRFSSDREVRHKAWLAIATTAKMLNPDVVKVVRMRAVEVRKMRARNYIHLMYSANDLDPLWMQKALSVVSRTTVSPYEDLLERIRSETGIEDLAPWDLDYGVEALSKARGAEAVEQKAFALERTVPVVEMLLRDLGLDPDRIALRAATGVIPTDYRDINVHIPGDLRLVTLRNPPRGIAPGEQGYDDLVRYYSRAAQAAYSRQTAPILKGYDCLPATRNTVWEDGIAWTISLFLHDPVFLKKRLDLNDKEIALLAQTFRDRQLLEDRRLLLDAGMDYILYTNPDADLDARWRKIFRTSLLIDIEDTDPTTWQADSTFFSGPPLHHVGFQSRAIAGDLYQTIIGKFGDKRFDPGTIGPWLTGTVFAPGEEMLLLNRLTQIVKGGYGLKNYFRQIGLGQ